jgi:hypothetical protein
VAVAHDLSSVSPTSPLDKHKCVGPSLSEHENKTPESILRKVEDGNDTPHADM